MKLFLRILNVVSGFFLFVLFLFPQSASAFSDLSPTVRGYTEVSFLSDAGIIKGVEKEGITAFEGERAVTRCELLRILISTQYRSLIYRKNVVHFNDIPPGHWCEQFAEFAVSRGIAQGVNGSFFPDQAVTKAEALKMTFQYFDFDLGNPAKQLFFDVLPSEWSFPYVSFASWYGIDESQNVFLPSQPLSRTEAAMLLYRSLWVAVYDAPFHDSYELKEGIFKKFQETLTPSNNLTLAKDVYPDITLDKELPTVFEENEIVEISGRAAHLGFPGKVTVVVYDLFNGQGRQFEAEVVGSSFRAWVVMPPRGSYFLDIVPGLLQRSDPQKIIVQNSSETFSISSPLSECDVKLEKNRDGDTEIFLDPKLEYDLSVSVESFRKKFHMEGITSLVFPYGALWGWPEGNILFTFVGKDPATKNVMCSSTKNIQAVTHHFTINNLMTTSVAPLSHYAEVGQTISWTGKSSLSLKSSLALIRPDGGVEHLDFNTSESSEILPMTRFSTNYAFKEPGVYRIEVNKTDGIADVNYPIYVGNVYPLLPDFKDVLRTYPPHFRMGNMELMRQKILQWVNEDRKKHGEKTVILDPLLNTLAQSHADDMVARGYFGHTSPEGETVRDRAKAAGITTTIGENLSQGMSLEDAYQGLLYSAIHRENLLDEEWNTLGIGIALSPDGIVHLDQEFSYKIFTSKNESEIESLTMASINRLRRDNQLPELKLFTASQPIVEAWSDTMQSSGVVDTQVADRSLLKNLQNNNFENVASGIVLRINNTVSLESELDRLASVFVKKDVNFGSVASSVDSSGKAFITIALFY